MSAFILLQGETENYIAGLFAGRACKSLLRVGCKRCGEVKKVGSSGWALGDGGRGKKLSVWAELSVKLKHI